MNLILGFNIPEGYRNSTVSGLSRDISLQPGGKERELHDYEFEFISLWCIADPGMGEINSGT